MDKISRSISDLKPNTRYSLRVKSVSRFNVGSEWSEVLEFITPDSPFVSPTGGLPRPVFFAGTASITVPAESQMIIPFSQIVNIWPRENVEKQADDSFITEFYARGTIFLDWEWES